MNILFLYERIVNPHVGGVERVTYVLANYFESKGHVCFFLGLEKSESLQVDQRQFFLPIPENPTIKGNIEFYQSFLRENVIDIVINQGGMSPKLSMLAYYAKEVKVKLISVLHNSPLAAIKNFSSSHSIQFKKKHISWILPLTEQLVVKKLLLHLYKHKYSSHYSRLTDKSDYIFLLSEKFYTEYIFLLGNKSLQNVVAIPNPLSFNVDVCAIEKKKEILYVGRINTSQKRVDLLLKIWQKLYTRHNDWSLKIVGGGDELELIKQMSIKLNLKNIHFYGFQEPQPFYKTASIFCMTSSYEGFGLTLIEAMQYRIIPIAFNSYLSITDIIDDKVNGFLVPPFDIDCYANTLSQIMTNADDRIPISVAAGEKAKIFCISRIGEQWLEIFKQLVN